MRVLSKDIIENIKQKSGLSFEQSKDYNQLSTLILTQTGRSIGCTTLKRLMGNIDDAREATEYTLNTIAQYLGADSWNSLIRQMTIESEMCYDDDSVYVRRLNLGQRIRVTYLNRIVVFEVINHSGSKALKVIDVKNGSLEKGDIAIVYRIRKGNVLEAERIIRGEDEWNYKTQGEITEICII